MVTCATYTCTFSNDADDVTCSFWQGQAISLTWAILLVRFTHRSVSCNESVVVLHDKFVTWLLKVKLHKYFVLIVLILNYNIRPRLMPRPVWCFMYLSFLPMTNHGRGQIWLSDSMDCSLPFLCTYWLCANGKTKFIRKWISMSSRNLTYLE